MEEDEDGGTQATVAEPLPGRARARGAETTAGLPSKPSHLAGGTQLGRFRIIELLGEGGMGAVYRATDAELDRQVALKVLSGEGESAAGGAFEQRLMREAQALAKLNHPNVIAIYDVARDNGVAFVAMELVEGVSLDGWLEQGKRSRADILAVFAQAGRGLAAAHEVGLVHRDFKPANVIVGTDKRVRVLDFGLARASGSHGGGTHHTPPPDDDASLRDSQPSISGTSSSGASSNLLANPLTLVGRVVGTPKYMAPEQLRGREIDARSDQFSFCVALYRFLYGEAPFGGRNLSERAANITAGRVRAASPGSDVPPWLRKVLLRGLAAEPGNRFPSMNALLEALADDPAPRRRRLIVGGLGLAVLAAGSVIVVHFTRGAGAPPACANVADGLATVWSTARRAEIAKTFGASDRPFAKKMLSSATDALDAYGKQWTAMRIEACRATRVTGEQSGELLDLRMQCLDRHLDHFRAATDVLATADAGVIEKALQVALALPPLAECADATALRAPPPLPLDPAKRTQIETLRTDLARSGSLFAAGKIDEATKLVARVHEQAPAASYAPLSAEAELAFGNSQFENGDFQAAEKTLANGAAVALTAHRDDLVVRMWRDLVLVVGDEQRRFPEAHAWASLAEAMLGRLRHDPHEQAKLYTAIAALYLREEHRDDALRYDQLALEIERTSFGDVSLEVAVALSNVGSDYLYKRDFAKARELSKRALDIREKLLGPDHPMTGRALLNLASATAEAGKPDEATALEQRALGILERALGAEHPAIATLLGNLGKSLAMSGKFDEALAAYDRAITIVTKAYGPKHAQLATLHARRGALRRRQDRAVDALAEYQIALAIDRGNDAESGSTGRDLMDIGDTLVALDRYAEAKKNYEQSYAVLAKALGPKDLELAFPLQGLGKVEIALEHPAAAIEPLEKALALVGTDDPTSVDVALVRFDLANALWDSGRDKRRARELAEMAKPALAASPDEQDKERLAEVTTWLSTKK